MSRGGLLSSACCALIGAAMWVGLVLLIKEVIHAL